MSICDLKTKTCLKNQPLISWEVLAQWASSCHSVPLLLFSYCHLLTWDRQATAEKSRVNFTFFKKKSSNGLKTWYQTSPLVLQVPPSALLPFPGVPSSSKLFAPCRASFPQLCKEICDSMWQWIEFNPLYWAGPLKTTRLFHFFIDYNWKTILRKNILDKEREIFKRIPCLLVRRAVLLLSGHCKRIPGILFSYANLLLKIESHSIQLAQKSSSHLFS